MASKSELSDVFSPTSAGRWLVPAITVRAPQLRARSAIRRRLAAYRSGATQGRPGCRHHQEQSLSPNCTYTKSGCRASTSRAIRPRASVVMSPSSPALRIVISGKALSSRRASRSTQPLPGCAPYPRQMESPKKTSCMCVPSSACRYIPHCRTTRIHDEIRIAAFVPPPRLSVRCRPAGFLPFFPFFGFWASVTEIGGASDKPAVHSYLRSCPCR